MKKLIILAAALTVSGAAFANEVPNGVNTRNEWQAGSAEQKEADIAKTAKQAPSAGTASKKGVATKAAAGKAAKHAKKKKADAAATPEVK